ncbi:MAG: DUF4339 domain-containing protein [Verrucomicrobiota bacterium]
MQYTFIGGDGREYGPHPLATIQQWIGEGRIDRQTRVRRGGGADWVSAGALAEFHWPSTPSLAAAAPPPPPAGSGPAPVPPGNPPAEWSAAADAAVKAYGNWFYWVAGLSAANLGLALMKSGFGFAIATMVTDVIWALTARQGGAGQALGLALNAVILGILCLLGWLAGRGHAWAFLVGAILYALDGVLAVAARQWIGVAFHGYVVWQLMRGFFLVRARR